MTEQVECHECGRPVLLINDHQGERVAVTHRHDCPTTDPERDALLIRAAAEYTPLWMRIR